MILPTVGRPCWRVGSGRDLEVTYLQLLPVALYPYVDLLSVMYRTYICRSEAEIPLDTSFEEGLKSTQRDGAKIRDIVLTFNLF